MVEATQSPKSSSASDSQNKTGSRREGQFDGHDGAELFYQSWLVENPRGTIVITHGYAEHSECYSETAEDFNRMGFNVMAWDLRGHGRSSGKRGYVDNFSSYIKDFDCFLKWITSGSSGSGKAPEGMTPNFILFGHSAGGLITTRYAIDQALHPTNKKPKSILLSSPLMGFSLAIPPIKDFASRLMNRFAPTLTLHNEIQYEDLTRDSAKLERYRHDPLRHDKISAGVYLGMIENSEYCVQQAKHLALPILMQSAGKDRIVSLPRERELFENIGSKDKRMLVYDESYHEIYNDLDRATVLKDAKVFFDATLA